MSNQNRQKDLLAPFTPPGMSDIRQLKVMGMGALVLVVLTSLTVFGIHYRMELGECYRWYMGRKMLIPGSRIPAFNLMMQHCFLGFWVYMACLIGQAANNYYVFQAPAKSIYVMKRIPDPREIHRRCLTLPLLGLAFGILLLFVCSACFGLYYQLATPAEVYPVLNLTQLWRALI